MQLSPIPQSWSQLIYLAAGVLIGLIPEIYRRYANSKKLSLENTETEARVEKTQAEAVSIRLRDDIATGEAVGKMLATLMTAGDELRDQQKRISELELDRIELVMRREEVRRMKALLTLNGIPYSDADKFRMK